MCKAGLDGQPRDFYVRQLWDWKTSADLDTILPQGLEIYAGSAAARSRALMPARAIASRSPSYLGKNDVFDRSIAEFAVAYADQNERDYDALVQAASDGRIQTQGGHLARLGGTCHSSALAPGPRRTRRRPGGASPVRRLVRRRAARTGTAQRAVRRRRTAGRSSMLSARGSRCGRSGTRTRRRRSARSTGVRPTARSSRLRRA